jgi:flagellar basal body-associated protein FliL
MSDDKAKKEEPKDKDKEAGGKAKGGGGINIVGVLLTAIVAGGAAFGGGKMANAKKHEPDKEPEPSSSIHMHVMKPPGPTIQLDPFVAGITDEKGKQHAMKVTMAIEFDAHAKEEEVKPYVPRIRDAIITFLRAQSFEASIELPKNDKMREELLEKVHILGATSAERVLVTDFVMQ